MWIISLTSFTCLYTAVTGRIIVWTRWWTSITFVFYSVLSICVYIAYVWFSDIWNVSLVQYTVVELHRTPLFWLVLLLIGGLLFCGDLMIEYWRFNNAASGSDYVRLYLT
jgi:H+/Cl- antiporter ClcA